MTDDTQVSYGIKELLSELKQEQAAGFARLETLIEGKADRADLARLESRLDEHANRIAKQGGDIGSLQQWKHDKELAADVHQEHKRRSWGTREKIWASLGTVGIILATVGGPLIALLIHH